MAKIGGTVRREVTRTVGIVGSDTGPERPSLLDALRRIAFGRRGPALASDVPKPSRFPGRKPHVHPGQLEVGE